MQGTPDLSTGVRKRSKTAPASIDVTEIRRTAGKPRTGSVWSYFVGLQPEDVSREEEVPELGEEAPKLEEEVPEHPKTPPESIDVAKTHRTAGKRRTGSVWSYFLGYQPDDVSKEEEVPKLEEELLSQPQPEEPQNESFNAAPTRLDEPQAGDCQIDPPQPQATHSQRPVLVLGQRIWAKMKIPLALHPAENPSYTEKKIMRGERLRKLAYVLSIGETHIIVAYTTTFGGSSELCSRAIDRDHWYPVSPATKHGDLDPLPAIASSYYEGEAWIYIGKPIKVRWKDSIDPLEEKLSPESLELLMNAMYP